MNSCEFKIDYVCVAIIECHKYGKSAECSFKSFVEHEFSLIGLVNNESTVLPEGAKIIGHTSLTVNP